MATEQSEKPDETTQATPMRQPDNQPAPRKRLANTHMIVIAGLLVLTLVVALFLGPGRLVMLSQASGAPLPWTNGTQTPAPLCPVLRTDPTLGVSLIDVSTQQPICERNPNGIAQPASTTKVMAALLVGQYLRAHKLSLDTPVTIQQIDTQVESDAAIAGLKPGQVYSVRALLYMTSILSAADAVMALARFVGGSRASFLALMNQEAQALGMQHTHYNSPYGYASISADNWQDGETTAEGNYSSAHDMALLTVAFAQYPELIIVFGATQYQQGAISINRGPGQVLPDSWIGLQTPDDPTPDPVQNLHLPFQVLAVKKGCMWCQNAIHKISYVLLVQFQNQEIAAAFLYTTQSYFNPLIGDMLPTLLWAFHQCTDPAYAGYCYPPVPTPTPNPAPTA